MKLGCFDAQSNRERAVSGSVWRRRTLRSSWGVKSGGIWWIGREEERGERELGLDGGDVAVSSWWGWKEAKEMEFGGLWERRGSGFLGFWEKTQE